MTGEEAAIGGRVVEIADADDPRIADYRDIRERDLVGRRGRFVAEGEVVLRVLFQRSRLAAASVLISTRRLPHVADLLAAAPASVPIYAAKPDVVERIAGFDMHRGVLAMGLRGDDADSGELLDSLPERAIVLVLVGVSNHDNVGGIFRNAAAFGADAVFLDASSCDPLYRKAIRVSVGGSLIVPFSRIGDPERFLETLVARGITPLALSPGGVETISGMDRPARAALLLGAEGPGLPAPLMAAARATRIDMAPGFDSLNVATASGIALHQLAFGSARSS